MGPWVNFVAATGEDLEVARLKHAMQDFEKENPWASKALYLTEDETSEEVDCVALAIMAELKIEASKGTKNKLEKLALNVPWDLVIFGPGVNGDSVVKAGHVTSANSWGIDEKPGLNLREIHQDIPGMNLAMFQKFLAGFRLQQGTFFSRMNIALEPFNHRVFRRLEAEKDTYLISKKRDNGAYTFEKCEGRELALAPQTLQTIASALHIRVEPQSIFQPQGAPNGYYCFAFATICDVKLEDIADTPNACLMMYRYLSRLPDSYLKERYFSSESYSIGKHNFELALTWLLSRIEESAA